MKPYTREELGWLDARADSRTFSASEIRCLLATAKQLMEERDAMQRRAIEALTNQNLHVGELQSELVALQAVADRYAKALRVCAIGAGRYSMDPLTHASNTIEDMKRAAREALEPPEAVPTSSGRPDDVTNGERGR